MSQLLQPFLQLPGGFPFFKRRRDDDTAAAPRLMTGVAAPRLKTGVAMTRLVTGVRNGAGADDDTAAAPMQFSTQQADSHLSRWAPLNWVTAAFFRGERLSCCWILARSVFCSILTWNVPNLLCRVETPRSCREGEGGRSCACHAGACLARSPRSGRQAGRRVRRRACGSRAETRVRAGPGLPSVASSWVLAIEARRVASVGP